MHVRISGDMKKIDGHRRKGEEWLASCLVSASHYEPRVGGVKSRRGE